jgi:hypothetical protein
VAIIRKAMMRKSMVCDAKVCPAIAKSMISQEGQPLEIGGSADSFPVLCGILAIQPVGQN